MNIARDALKAAVMEKGIKPQEIMRYAGICRVDRIIKPILELFYESDIKNLQASVRHNSRRKRKKPTVRFQKFCKYYGMERFLYRFSRSKYADKFIRKALFCLTYGRFRKGGRPLI